MKMKKTARFLVLALTVVLLASVGGLVPQGGAWFVVRPTPEPPPDVVAAGMAFSFRSGALPPPAELVPLPGAAINLTTNTLELPAGLNIKAYSLDGGRTWTAGARTGAEFAALLDSGADLWLCFLNFNRNAGKPQGSGNRPNIIVFTQ